MRSRWLSRNYFVFNSQFVKRTNLKNKLVSSFPFSESTRRILATIWTWSNSERRNSSTSLVHNLQSTLVSSCRTFNISNEKRSTFHMKNIYFEKTPKGHRLTSGYCTYTLYHIIILINHSIFYKHYKFILTKLCFRLIHMYLLLNMMTIENTFMILLLVK